jgi:hypothetical protein
MRCARCHRALLNPALTIETKDGSIYFGAGCVVKAGLRQRRQRRAGAPKPSPQRDKRTRDWVDELCGAGAP